MPLRRHQYRNENCEVPHYEDNDGPPPPPTFNDGVHPALTKFMAKTNRHFAEVVVRIPLTVA